jgi:Na+/H+-dicarboxylate symporter
MGKYIAVLGGLVAMAGGLALVIVSAAFRHAFVHLVLGFVPPILFFGGLIGLIAGISSIKDAQRTKKLEQETAEKKEEKKEG